MQYVKIKDAIVEQIDTGLLMPRQKLPAERKLAESFDTTRVTLREALSLLEIEGKIYREDRRGWFISPEPLKYDPNMSLSFDELARQQGRRPETEVVVAKSLLATKQASLLLNLGPFSDVHRVDRVRYLDRRPVVYVTNFIRPETAPDLLSSDLTQSLTQAIQQNYGMVVQKSRYRIGMASLLGETAAALRATPGAPAMVIERVKYDQHGVATICDIEFWRHDAICIESVAEQPN
ncbi:phosphonate utilization transcriptional regulator PhnR [Vibrio sp. SCSIO 43136]|uniref:phosphonate utilization transcriptional regulator PhnR n=1 Tax=Vibrio sp. SCSIO 43136 TaxID=2819101 RepID=UPI002075124E|nr:phosphonate utilization transcriptional regulator PhnR [Vibrio sp. SCSIO 43136]USD67696.1 phosphonate utilization transcriptional regulator PhnR [Vibrio sp. SCSIO 43136]